MMSNIVDLMDQVVQSSKVKRSPTDDASYQQLWRLRDQLESQLRSQYSELFDQCFDFSPPGGWLPVIIPLIDKLAGFTDVKLKQVKEKFGQVRIYVDSNQPEVHKLIEQAESDLHDKCSVCGAAGMSRPGGWIIVLCDEHANHYKE